MARAAKVQTEPVRADGADVWRDGGLSIAEAVRFSGVGRSKLYVEMDMGKLPFTKIGRRRVVARRGLVDLLAQGTAR